MSKLGLVMVLILMVGRNNAQNYSAPTSDPPTFFVLIQADDGQAFYVRLNTELYTSSPAGHLILAPLTDSAYTITIGFPGQTFPEQRYLLNIHQRDWSLRLTRQNNRWGLYDDQGQAVATVADPANIEKPLLAGAKKDDAFSQLMSAIVQDTAVMYNTFNATAPDSGQPAPAATASTRITPDTITSHPAAGTPTSAPAIMGTPTSISVPPVTGTPVTGTPVSVPPTSTIDPAVPSSPTGVVQLSERKSPQSLSLVYSDHPADKRADTIDVVIPIDSPTNASPATASPTTASPATTAAPATAASPTTASHPPQNPKPDTPALASTASHKSALPFVNSDCRAFATDYDVDKLRVRMLDAAKDEDRIQVAYKIFKIKCFTTKQIRALSEVFTTDPAKFKFLATAYPFVSDDQFPELVNLLSDPVYSGKFRTMTDRH